MIQLLSVIIFSAVLIGCTTTTLKAPCGDKGQWCAPRVWINEGAH